LCAVGFAPSAVYTQPPRPVGRGLRLAQPPVAVKALELGLPLRQPETLQTRTEIAWLRDLAPDVILTAAYGKIFRATLLDLPRRGCLNLHPSLLPRYRGLSPVAAAILNGDRVTGVTLYRMSGEVDAGPIVAQAVTPIGPEEPGGNLTARLAVLAGELVVRHLRAWVEGEIVAQPQDEERASFAPRLERADGEIDWRLPAPQIVRLVRALSPWPGTYTYCRETRVKILDAAAVDETPRRVPPGTIVEIGRGLPPCVAALPGAVALRVVQPENCRPQDGASFCCGQRLQPGQRLTPTPRPEVASAAREAGPARAPRSTRPASRPAAGDAG
jgi:methionyl-tRNA formyltransferase